MAALSPDKALIFRITHIANVPWILANGLHCQSSVVSDPAHIGIGNASLINKRQHRVVPIAPGGTLADYVPFYFTPFSPMLYNIKTGRNGVTQRPMAEIAILVTSLLTLRDNGIAFVFTDMHAFLEYATFSSDLAALGDLAWPAWVARDFRRDPDNPAKFDRYQAEALAHQHVPVGALKGIICNGPAQEASLKKLVQNAAVNLDVHSKPDWYV